MTVHDLWARNYDDPNTLRVTWGLGADSLTFDSFAERTDRLVDLLVIGLFVPGAVAGRQIAFDNDAITGRSKSIRRSLVITRISYASPLTVSLTWASSAAVCFSATRGALYLWSTWLDVRVRAKQAKVDVAALKLIHEAMPKNVPELLASRAHAGNHAEILDYLRIEQRISSAGKALTEISNLEFTPPDEKMEGDKGDGENGGDAQESHDD